MDINIGDRIAQLRKSKGITVNGLANKAGVSQSYLREIELGHYENPTIEILDAICGALEISLSNFFSPIKDNTIIEESLLAELKSLTPSQRDQLKNFLKCLKS